MSGISLTERQALITKFGTDAAYGCVFTGDPGTGPANANEATGGSPAYARVALVWSAPDSNGQITASANFNVPAGTYTYVGTASASTGATVTNSVAITSTTYAAQAVLTVNFVARMP